MLEAGIEHDTSVSGRCEQELTPVVLGLHRVRPKPTDCSDSFRCSFQPARRLFIDLAHSSPHIAEKVSLPCSLGGKARYPGQAWRNGISLRIRDSDGRLAGVDIHLYARSRASEPWGDQDDEEIKGNETDDPCDYTGRVLG